MDEDLVQDIASEVSDKFADMLEGGDYFSVVAGTALALAGLALDLPPDADLTEEEAEALQRLFDEISKPLTSIIKLRLTTMEGAGPHATN